MGKNKIKLESKRVNIQKHNISIADLGIHAYETMRRLVGERLEAFLNNRWLVFVAAIWIQIFAGIGYLYGSMSPVIKSSLDYNQRQIASLGVASDLGGNVGFLAGSLCEVLPSWGPFLIGSLQNLVGYGGVWLTVTGRSPPLPFWVLCILMFIGSNGQTYFNTADLVSCVQNFPKSRGPVVGILKGFAGLGGAILTQFYAVVHSPDNASLIFMVAVVPTIVIIALMFTVRPVRGHNQVRSYDGMSFSFIYVTCLLLAAYLMVVMLLEDLFDFSHSVIIIFTVFLSVLLLIPILIPVSLSFCREPSNPAEAAFLPQPHNQKCSESEHIVDRATYNEVDYEKADEEVDLLSAPESQKRIIQPRAVVVQAAAGAVSVKKRRGPRRGEDFTLVQALIKADFWLIFFSFLLGTGSGLTVIGNLGQISQSLGYDNTHIFVSLISIWNFLGRIGGGYLSEIIVRDYAYPRPMALAVAQVIMAFGHFFLAMGWNGAMYIGTLLIGLGYGSHWAIVPAAVSELFGLKNFGVLYNFLTLASPVGSLIFSVLIASGIYDSEAEKQAHHRQHPHPYQRGDMGSMLLDILGTDEPLKCEGAICFFLTCMLMSGLCIVAVVLSMILVYRTKIVYTHLYGKSHA